jgi:hypothetical protein
MEELLVMSNWRRQAPWNNFAEAAMQRDHVSSVFGHCGRFEIDQVEHTCNLLDLFASHQILYNIPTTSVQDDSSGL